MFFAWRLPPLAMTDLLSQGVGSGPNSSRLTALGLRQQGINLDETLPSGDPWAFHPRKVSEDAQLPESTNVRQLGGPAVGSVPYSSQDFSPRSIDGQSPKAREISSTSLSSRRISSNKQRKGFLLDEISPGDRTLSPVTELTPTSSSADSCLEGDDGRVCKGERKPNESRAVFRDGMHSNEELFSSPTIPHSHIAFASSLVGSDERRLRKTERKRRHRLTERDRSSINIADTKEKIHSNNERVRRRAETRTIYKIDELLPPELLVDLRMWNLKQGHTKLQILEAAVRYLEGLSDDVKQCTMEKCRKNLAKAVQSQERYSEVGTGRWDADDGLEGLSSILIQTPPPSNRPSPQDTRFH